MQKQTGQAILCRNRQDRLTPLILMVSYSRGPKYLIIVVSLFLSSYFPTCLFVHTNWNVSPFSLLSSLLISCVLAGCPLGHLAQGGVCVNIDECDSNPCQNGASCTDETYGYTCKCRPAFSGERCEIKHSTCLDNPGICVVSAS